MPVSVRRSPFHGEPPKDGAVKLRTPQARVLAALQPDDPSDPVSEWPLVTRAQLGVRAGYTAISGTVTRALNGIKPGSSSGDAHPGLLMLGMVEEVVLDVEGVTEVNYRATTEGVSAYRLHCATSGASLPPLRDAATCTNDRYRRDADQNSEEGT